MRIRRHDGGRLVLTGPPGGWGTVALILVVGTALGGGGALFAWHAWTTSSRSAAIAPAVVSVLGTAAFVWGVGMLFTRDRLELDRIAGEGRWTRRLLGRDVERPVTFDLERATRLRVESFVDAAPSQRGTTGGTPVEKVRAVLLVTRPRKKIVLDEAERQREPRVRGVAEPVAELLGIEVESGR